MMNPYQPAPAEIVAAVEDEAADLEGYWAGLKEEDLDRPSACGEWTCGEVLAHLTWASTYFDGLIERGLRGDTSPPANLPPPGPARRQTIADAAKRGRAQWGAGLREAFRDGNERLAERLRSLAPEEWDVPTAHRAGAVRYLAQTRLNELAVHGWDIRSRLDPPGHLFERALPTLIAGLDRWFRVLAQPDPSLTGTRRIRLVFADPRVPTRDVVFDADSARLEPAGDGTPDLVCRMAPEAVPLLLYGRITVDEAIQEYGLTLVGQADLAGLLRSRFETV